MRGIEWKSYTEQNLMNFWGSGKRRKKRKTGWELSKSESFMKKYRPQNAKTAAFGAVSTRCSFRGARSMRWEDIGMTDNVLI